MVNRAENPHHALLCRRDLGGWSHQRQAFSGRPSQLHVTEVAVTAQDTGIYLRLSRVDGVHLFGAGYVAFRPSIRVT